MKKILLIAALVGLSITTIADDRDRRGNRTGDSSRSRDTSTSRGGDRSRGDYSRDTRTTTRDTRTTTRDDRSRDDYSRDTRTTTRDSRTTTRDDRSRDDYSRDSRTTTRDNRTTPRTRDDRYRDSSRSRDDRYRDSSRSRDDYSRDTRTSSTSRDDRYRNRTRVRNGNIRHIPDRTYRDHSVRYRTSRDFHRTISRNYVYNNWIRFTFNYTNGYYYDSYPYYVFNGYRYRYSYYDNCNYELVDSYDNRVEETFYSYSCATGYDRCSDLRDQLNDYEYSDRYFCAERYEY